MPTHHVTVGENRLTMWWSNWNGRERMEYNGVPVSEKRNLSKFVSPHLFTVEENGQAANYDLRFTGYMGHVIRRNGEIVAEKHRPVVRYFLPFGLLYLSVVVVSWILEVLVDEGAREQVVSWTQGAGLLVAFLGAFVLSARIKRQLIRP